jgi:hypothetical protein
LSWKEEQQPIPLNQLALQRLDDFKIRPWRNVMFGRQEREYGSRIPESLANDLEEAAIGQWSIVVKPNGAFKLLQGLPDFGCSVASSMAEKYIVLKYPALFHDRQLALGAIFKIGRV